MGVDLRNFGTFATYAPRIKRATGTLTTGQSVHVLIDTNMSMGGGANASGTPFLYIYLSTDANRTAYTQALIYTTIAVPAAPTRGAVFSSCLMSNNNLLVAYQGMDNSLRLITFTFSGGTYTGGSEQLVVASGAITNRFRALDVDTIASGTGVAIAAYEANAATGQGAWARVYVRKDDNTTWVKAWEDNFLSTQFILDKSEDICIAWNFAGIAANVGQLALYYNRSSTTSDLGDRVVELSVNINTVTTNSATTVGSWFNPLHQNIAAGTRKGWLFSEASGVWMFATAIGTTSPVFMSCRLYHNVFTGIVQNKLAPSFGNIYTTQSAFVIDRRMFSPGAVACDYSDGRVIFAYPGFGYLTTYTTRSTVMRYSTVTTSTVALSIDTSPRILDGGYSFQDGLVSIYGGGNSRILSGDLQWNFLAFYGQGGASTPAVTYDTFDRTVASGFGVPNTGGTGWSVVGTASGYNTNGSQGTMALTAVNTAYVALLAGNVVDSVQYCDFSFGQVPTGASWLAGMVSRYTSSTNFYEVLLAVSTANVVTLQINKNVAGTLTTLGAALTTAITHAAGNIYRVKFRTVGTTLEASVWVYNSAEPGAYQITRTDGSLVATGQNGIKTSRNTGNTNATPVTTVDNYSYGVDGFSFTNLRRMRAITEDVPSAPVVLSPVNTVVAVNAASIRVQIQNISLYSNVLGKVEVQLATDAGFTTNLRTVAQSDADYASLSATTGTTPPIRTATIALAGSDKLFAGTWYVRSRVVDDLGGASAYGDTSTFVVSHPPAAQSIAPMEGTSLNYGTGDVAFSWTFSDTEASDSQSAYQLVIVRQDSGAVVYDSGKVVSSVKSVVRNLASGLKDVPLQWTVALWDSSNTQGPPSRSVLFTVVDPPTVAITSPTAGGTVTTALPTITWNFTAGGVRTQRAYRVLIYNTDVNPDLVVADTGWLMGANTSWTSVTQILQEGVNYQVYVYVQDSVGLTSLDNKVFITDWIPPVVASGLTLSSDPFKVTVTWTNAAQDAGWVSYRVYRRYMVPAISDLDIDHTATVWTLMYETTTAQSNYTFLDYASPLNKPIDYVVVQLADRFGSLIESDITAFSTITQAGDRYYFVPEVPIGTIAAFEAANVTSDGFTKEVEQATIHVKGRGRQLQVGDDLGYTGTLTIKLRNPLTARRDREFFEFLSSDDAGNVWLRSPFGDVLYVSFGNVQTNRIPGVGTSDLSDLSVPYSVVFGTLAITRDS